MLFNKPGKENTESAVTLALTEAEKLSIRHIVVASYTGYTADFFKARAKDFNIVIVRGTYGFDVTKPNEIRMSAEKCKELEACGMTIVTGAHVLSGAERALSKGFSGVYPVEVMAHTLRMFGQGTKVCVECAAMACDAGAVPAGEKIISVGGSAMGADTVLLMQASNTHTLLNTKICAVLCKPSLY